MRAFFVIFRQKWHKLSFYWCWSNETMRPARAWVYKLMFYHWLILHQMSPCRKYRWKVHFFWHRFILQTKQPCGFYKSIDKHKHGSKHNLLSLLQCTLFLYNKHELWSIWSVDMEKHTNLISSFQHTLCLYNKQKTCRLCKM